MLKHVFFSAALSTSRHLSIDFLPTLFRTRAIFLRSLSCRGLPITPFAQTFKLLLQDFQFLVR